MYDRRPYSDPNFANRLKPCDSLRLAIVQHRQNRSVVKILKITLIVIAAIIAVCVIGVFGYLKFGLAPAHFAGRCESLDLNQSAEDIQVDRERGIAYLSLIDRLTLARGGKTQGWIGALDLTGESRIVEPALLDKPGHFRPHGINIYIGATGQRSLFVINHPVHRGEEQELVELFTEEMPGRYRHAETFAEALFTTPNDIVAVGPRQFYVANDDGSARDGKPRNLVYFDGSKAHAVVDDIAAGGGINVSTDGNLLYVAETGGKNLRVLRRNTTDGSVETLTKIPLGTSPDNIDVADDGSLWIGAHSSLFALIMHFIAGTDAPAQVLRVALDDEAGATVEEIYMNRGDEISASSVGATYGNKLLIGSITDRKILICEMDGV